jgi:hypothetical protein
MKHVDMREARLQCGEAGLAILRREALQRLPVEAHGGMLHRLGEGNRAGIARGERAVVVLEAKLHAHGLRAIREAQRFIHDAADRLRVGLCVVLIAGPHANDGRAERDCRVEHGREILAAADAKIRAVGGRLESGIGRADAHFGGGLQLAHGDVRFRRPFDALQSDFACKREHVRDWQRMEGDRAETGTQHGEQGFEANCDTGSTKPPENYT